MKARIFSVYFFVVSLVLLVMLTPTGGLPVSAQGPNPTSTPRRESVSQPALRLNQVSVPPIVINGSIGALPVTWSTCGACPQSVEVSISGNTITLGIANRGEHSTQNIAYHGASTQLPPAAKYTISFDYMLYTWDSYQPSTMQYKGYWDSFSVSVSGQPYWQLPLSDPVTPQKVPGLVFITGGSTWGQGILQKIQGSQTITVPGNPSGSNYLNVILDTASFPASDNLFPSWGTITIKDISTDTNLPVLGSQAANLAKSVIGGPYGWGGKGWDWNSHVYVDAQVIQSGSLYSYWVAANKKVELKSGVDCAGLIYWAFDKAAGSTKYYGSPIWYEGANEQCANNQSDSVANASDLRPGDLLCFQFPSVPHVAMYVGGTDSTKDVIEAGGIGVDSDKIHYSSMSELSKISEFRGFRRVKPAIVPLKIQTYSPVTLVVTDPDGITVDANTLLFTGEEYIRGVPGVLYYSTDTNFDDFVYAPLLKTGVYTIRVVPKPGALPTDTFSLEVIGASKLVVLAENVPISKIPSQPFGILSTGNEIVPTQPTIIYNAPPTLTIPGNQTVQYSDALSFGISANDPESTDTLVLSASGLPSGLTFTDNHNRTGTVTGTVQVAAGTYPVTFSVNDGFNPPVTASLNIIVTREYAVVTPSATNPLYVKVNTAGGTAGPITLRATITEANDDPNNGNISNAQPVNFTLQPVGSGSPINCTASTSGGGVGGTLTATCTFNNVPVNVYDVHIVIGGNYYTGTADSVLAIYDPSLGFTTGGGTIMHNGVVANFGFNFKYLSNGQTQGHMLYIEHRATGDVILKSNAIGSMSIVKNSDTSYTAITLGKATLNGVGNYSFQLTATDNGEPGTSDQFGLQIKSPDGKVVIDLTFTPTTLTGGNIQVPHK